jgi:hypothetical protein
MVTLFFVSCVGTQSPSVDFVSKLNRGEVQDNSSLMFGMPYRMISENCFNIGVDYKEGEPTRYIKEAYALNPVFFFSNGVVLFDEGIAVDSVGFVNTLPKSGSRDHSLSNWGVYELNGNKIKATFYMSFRTRLHLPGHERLLTYYEGTLINSDTIKEWHMVRPYPEKAVKLTWNQDYLTSLSTPRDLYLKKDDLSSLIDEQHPWIMQFKDGDKKNNKKR